MAEVGSMQWTVASGLLMGGIVTIVGASVGWLVIYLRRVGTRQWKDFDIKDSVRSSAIKAALYKTARLRFLVYFIVGLYLVAFGLLIASGIAKLAGA